IFGSVAREEDDENSDIDFLIDYDLEKTTSWFPMGLILDLEAFLQRKVDVATDDSLHYFIRDKVLEEAVKL
ncbi:MAG: DNA polymerase subunit beta, partial [Okeania sp. SIO3C4]|nr:DNA polymerase subunit beta [Okeania sp. SIO3C4]